MIEPVGEGSGEEGFGFSEVKGDAQHVEVEAVGGEAFVATRR